MDDEPFYSPNRKPPPPPKPTPVEHIWTVRKGGHAHCAELRNHGEAGVELQLLHDGEWYYGLLRPSRALAIEEADFCRFRLEAEVWR